MKGENVMKMATNKIIEIWFSAEETKAKKYEKKIGQMRTNARTKGGKQTETAKTGL